MTPLTNQAPFERSVHHLMSQMQRCALSEFSCVFRLDTTFMRQL